MDKDKEADIRCMCLKFATDQCPGFHPDIVLEVANKYFRFVTNARPDLRVVSNDSGKPAA